jgi:hypothetical protein
LQEKNWYPETDSRTKRQPHINTFTAPQQLLTKIEFSEYGIITATYSCWQGNVVTKIRLREKRAEKMKK